MSECRAIDRTGREIVVGDYLIYGHALGRCAGIQFGKVLGLKAREKSWGTDAGVTVTVIGVDEDFDMTPRLLSREGHLLFPRRTVALDADRVPDEIRALLDGYERKPRKKQETAGPQQHASGHQTRGAGLL